MTQGLKLTLLGRHQLANEIFFSHQMEVSVEFFLHRETQKHEDISLHESIP